METKNIGALVGAVIIGIIIGWGIWGGNSGVHRMPDGSMMDNRGHSMDTMMDDMNAALRGKTGDEFDRAFIDEMIVHHQGAIDMAKLVLETSKRSELITLANDIITAQTREIDMMKQWREAWFQ